MKKKDDFREEIKKELKKIKNKKSQMQINEIKKGEIYSGHLGK